MINVKVLFGRNEGRWHQEEGKPKNMSIQKEEMKLVGVRKEDEESKVQKKDDASVKC